MAQSVPTVGAQWTLLLRTTHHLHRAGRRLPMGRRLFYLSSAVWRGGHRQPVPGGNLECNLERKICRFDGRGGGTGAIQHQCARMRRSTRHGEFTHVVKYTYVCMQSYIS
jgi:hypothetical protein